jgi:hypothetical protein
MTKVPALRRYGTKYELVLSSGSRRYLVGYCLNKSRSQLLTRMRLHGVHILAVTQMPEDACAKWDASTGTMTLGAWTIRFSGRTQKDAICTQSELPYVGAVPVEA